MRVRVTSISWSEVAAKVRSVTSEMEAALGPFFKDASFGGGVEQLMIVLVSASSDEDENDRIGKGYDGVRTRRNPLTNESTKSFGFGVQIRPEVLSGLDADGLRQFVRQSILMRIEQPGFRIPKTFNYPEFSRQLHAGLLG